MKVTKVFKVIITTLLVIAFTVSVISCKEAPVVEEQAEEQQIEEKGEVTIPSETKEETKETQEITPETTVEEEVVEEIVNAAEIPGLEFNPKTLEYTTEDDRYGVPKGEIVGVLSPHILKVETIDGTPGKFEDRVLSLAPEVIKVLQAKALEEKGEYFWPLLVDVRNISSLGLTELKSLASEVKYLGMTVPMGTNFYSLFDANFESFINPNPSNDKYPDEGVIDANFDVNSKDMEGGFTIYAMKENLLLDDKKFELTPIENADGQEFTIKTVHVDSGELIGKIISEKPLRALKNYKRIEDKGEHQLILQILGQNRSKYLGGFDPILTVDNTLVAFLPKETK